MAQDASAMIVGPDGFLATREDPRFEFHSLLNEVLREQAKDPARAHEIAGAAVKRLRKEFSEERLAALALAAFDRALWIDAHRAELAQSLDWTRRLAAVLYHLYTLKPPFAVSDMCRLMDGRHGTAPPVGRVAEYFASRELTPDACAALRRRREALKARIGRDYGHVDVQSELQLLDMLLWHDEMEPLELAACWSERVRRDRRAMSGERRQRWQALLRHIRGDAGSKPPKPWIKEAQARLAAVGAEDFRATLARWFACFREPEPLRLSAVGSHVLKGLLWYCALARDPALTEAALPLPDAPWKPRRNLDKVMVALALLIDTMPVEQAWAARVTSAAPVEKVSADLVLRALLERRHRAADMWTARKIGRLVFGALDQIGTGEVVEHALHVGARVVVQVSARVEDLRKQRGLAPFRLLTLVLVELVVAGESAAAVVGEQLGCAVAALHFEDTRCHVNHIDFSFLRQITTPS